MPMAGEWLAATVYSAKPHPRVHAVDVVSRDLRDPEVMGNAACGLQGAGRRTFAVVNIARERIAADPARFPATFRGYAGRSLRGDVCPACLRLTRLQPTPVRR